MSRTAATEIRDFETDVEVAETATVANDVVQLTLSAVSGTQLPPWTPGAHIDLVLGDDLVRQYSLCGDPADRSHYRVAVLRTESSRGGSEAVHRLVAGDKLRIRGPRNNFRLSPADNYVFIAGGIGITPLLPMIAQVQSAGIDWELHYGGRTIESMAFAEALSAYGEKVHNVPQDVHGFLDLDDILATPRPGSLVYCCGPEQLLQAVEERCSARSAVNLHVERFTPNEALDPSGDTRFEVVLARSGLTLTVEPGVSVFDTIRSAGVNVLGSCFEGICGTCEQTVLEGEIDHRDSVLDPSEQAANDCMMICVSRARGARLVLEA